MNWNLVDVADLLGINQNSCKTIFRLYKKTGRMTKPPKSSYAGRKRKFASKELSINRETGQRYIQREVRVAKRKKLGQIEEKVINVQIKNLEALSAITNSIQPITKNRFKIILPGIEKLKSKNLRRSRREEMLSEGQNWFKPLYYMEKSQDYIFSNSNQQNLSNIQNNNI